MSGEEASGTVLHRLIQEHLRYGNPTDAHTLLAIQQQALRRGGGVGGGSGGTCSPQSSTESLQDEPQSPQLSARQEPQGQEHQVDFQHSENYKTYPHHGEELPSYEQAKAHSQHLASQWCQPHKGCSLQDSVNSQTPFVKEDNWDPKRGHTRSLSERLLHLSMERNTSNSFPATSLGCSYSYPQVHGYHTSQHLAHSQPGMDYSNQNPHMQSQGFMLRQELECEQYYRPPPPPFYSHHNRNIPPMQSSEVCHIHATMPPAGRVVLACSPSQVKMLIQENTRLRQELEEHTEKAIKIQKLEQEIQRISEAYDTLMEGCAKREALEQALRNKLMGEIKRLQQSNIQAAKEAEAADHNQHVMVKLLMQNEEQQLRCVRLEQEVKHLHNEAEEQLRRSESLEDTLRSTKMRSQQLWVELQKKNAYVEKVERLQGALSQMQAACEKRERLEMRLRTRLEQELRSLRNQQREPQPISRAHVSVSSLQELLQEKEECILSLEADKIRWEQKYLEEKTMREFAMDAAATAAAQRDTTIINHHSPCHSSTSSFIEELPSSEHRNQEVENRIRALHIQILEKDTVINMLKNKLEKESGGLRPAASEPSISPSHHTGQCKGKSHSDDQTSGTSYSSHSLVVVQGQSEPMKHATEYHSTEFESKLNDMQQPPSSVNLFKGLDDVEAEAVEIFI